VQIIVPSASAMTWADPLRAAAERVRRILFRAFPSLVEHESRSLCAQHWGRVQIHNAPAGSSPPEQRVFAPKVGEHPLQPAGFSACTHAQASGQRAQISFCSRYSRPVSDDDRAKDTPPT
jgi:hypothetical protein